MFQYFPSRALRARVILAILSALAMVGVFVAAPGPARADTPGLTTISATASTDPSISADLGGSSPQVLTAVGRDFDVTVTLLDAQGQALPAAENTPVTFTAADSAGDETANLTAPASAVIPLGASSATFQLSYGAATSTLVVSAHVSALAGSTTAFLVNKSLTVLSGNDPSLQNGTAGADGADCTTVDAANPICGIVTLPNGTTQNVAMTLGPCESSDAQNCRAGDVVTQFIGDLSSSTYTRTNPARMTIVCDASICGAGGVPSYRGLWSPSGQTGFSIAAQCPRKGVIGSDQSFCTDSVSSNRGRNGDLQLVVLFLQDVRGTI